LSLCLVIFYIIGIASNITAAFLSAITHKILFVNLNK